jgi:hypothetical protein
MFLNSICFSALSILEISVWFLYLLDSFQVWYDFIKRILVPPCFSILFWLSIKLVLDISLATWRLCAVQCCVSNRESHVSSKNFHKCFRIKKTIARKSNTHLALNVAVNLLNPKHCMVHNEILYFWRIKIHNRTWKRFLFFWLNT